MIRIQLEWIMIYAALPTSLGAVETAYPSRPWSDGVGERYSRRWRSAAFSRPRRKRVATNCWVDARW